MDRFDYIIAGGGAAGLSLAYQLVHSSLRDRRILVVDRDKKQANDRTWCFWTTRPTFFNSIYFRSWQKVAVRSEGFTRTFDLGDFRYNMLRGIDFYSLVLQDLSVRPNVEILTADIQQILDTPEGVQVTAGGQSYQADWAFDSRFNPADWAMRPDRYHYLKQHFTGWEVETETEVFDPSLPVLFDFRAAQEGGLHFFYTLPFSATEALVEYTVFSADLLSPSAYEEQLGHYLTGTLKIGPYQVRAVEKGIIPMSDHPFPRRLGDHTLAIGTLGGRVKASTGYAFLRIQADSAAIIRSLEQHGHPFAIKPEKPRYRLFDSILLQILYRQGNQAKPIFEQMFRNNPIQRVFEFLDESANWLDNYRFIASLPPLPFLKALVRLKLLHRI